MISPFRMLPITKALVLSAYHQRDFTEIEYEAEGKTYVGCIEESSFFVTEGKHISIAYDPNQPERFYTLLEAKKVALIGALGFLLILCSRFPQRAIYALRQKRRTRRGAWTVDGGETRERLIGGSDPLEEQERMTRRQDFKRRLIYFGVGGLVLVFSIFRYTTRQTEFRELPTVSAMVVEAHSGGRYSSGSCKLEYTVDGQAYSGSLNEYHKKGKMIKVYYEPENPQKVYSTDNHNELIISLFGLGFILCGLILNSHKNL